MAQVFFVVEKQGEEEGVESDQLGLNPDSSHVTHLFCALIFPICEMGLIVT